MTPLTKLLGSFRVTPRGPQNGPSVGCKKPYDRHSFHAASTRLPHGFHIPPKSPNIASTSLNMASISLNMASAWPNMTPT